MKKVRKNDTKKTKEFSKISIALLLIIMVVFIGSPLKNWYEDQSENFISQKTIEALERELEIKKSEKSFLKESLTYLATMPASLFIRNYKGTDSINMSYDDPDFIKKTDIVNVESVMPSQKASDYSSTNVQEENVDEADIVKTDGKYIYSISGNSVVVTNAYPAENLEKISTVEISKNTTLIDMIIKDDKMIVVGNNNKSNTEVVIFDMKDKKNIKKMTSYKIEEEYFTSRAVDNELYILTSSKVEENNILPIYYVNNNQINMQVDKFKYLKKASKDIRTTVASIDIERAKIKDVSSYAINAKDMYMSENYMYITSTSTKRDKKVDISKIYGLKGVFALAEAAQDEGYKTTTSIYKFSLSNKGINVVAKGEIEGKTLNQFSMDEYRGNLRVSLTTNEDNSLVVFDKNMDVMGQLENLAKGEKIYSTRFIKDRAYIVTYKTIDPLFVIDLKDPTSPKVLGELKIPGYSSYLHPYDKDTIIGIGMDTTENVYRDDFGKVLSTSTRLKGLKLALFDISDVSNPKEKASITIGDSSTYSPILKNHKALLFNKNKGILAIPVSGLNKQINVVFNSTNVNSINNMYNGYSKYIKDRGLLVFDISKDAIIQKGIILDNTDIYSQSIYSSYNRYNSVRGIYLDDVIYAVSSNKIQAVELETLKPIKDIEI